MFYAIANTVIRQVVGVVAPPVIPMIWNLNTKLWEDENRTWN